MKHALCFVVVIAGLVAGSRASVAACRPAALLDGTDAMLIDRMDAALVERGVATRATRDCPAARVRVERRGLEVWVAVTDPDGRRSERTLVDIDSAATVVATWSRQDLNAAALLGWVEPTPETVAAPRDAAPALPSAANGRRRDPITAAATFELSRSTDAQTWLGARVAGCVRVGPVCAGVAARLQSGDAARSYDGLATLDIPLPLAPRAIVTAGVGAGLGHYAGDATRGEATMITDAHTGARLDAHVGISLVLARSVCLDVGIAAGVTPGAATFDASADMPRPEPDRFVRGALGLRIGVP